MTIRKKVLIIFAILILLILSIGSFIMWQLGLVGDYLKNNVPQAISTLKESTYLDSIAQLIRYDDEVLTQSARNYAFTGDKKWKLRYDEFVPKLDLRINQALEKADAEDQEFFSKINYSNLALVEMEVESIALVDEGKNTEAQKILDSSEYQNQKNIYKDNLDKYLTKRGLAVDQAAILSTNTLNQANDYTRKMASFSSNLLGIFIILVLVLLGFLYLIIFRSLINPLFKLKDATGKISKGDLVVHLDIKSQDEIGQLANSFNQMAKDLKYSRTNIEQKVSQRTEELQKLNRFMTGRELKMIELKKKIKELKK